MMMASNLLKNLIFHKFEFEKGNDKNSRALMKKSLE